MLLLPEVLKVLVPPSVPPLKVKSPLVLTGTLLLSVPAPLTVTGTSGMAVLTLSVPLLTVSAENVGLVVEARLTVAPVTPNAPEPMIDEAAPRLRVPPEKLSVAPLPML